MFSGPSVPPVAVVSARVNEVGASPNVNVTGAVLRARFTSVLSIATATVGVTVSTVKAVLPPVPGLPLPSCQLPADRVPTVLGLIDGTDQIGDAGHNRAAMPAVNRPVHLGDSSLGGRQWDETLGHEPWADRRPFVNDPVVVRPDAGQLEFTVQGSSEGLTSTTGHHGIQD